MKCSPSRLSASTVLKGRTEREGMERWDRKAMASISKAKDKNVNFWQEMSSEFHIKMAELSDLTLISHVFRVERLEPPHNCRNARYFKSNVLFKLLLNWYYLPVGAMCSGGAGRLVIWLTDVALEGGAGCFQSDVERAVCGDSYCLLRFQVAHSVKLPVFISWNLLLQDGKATLFSSWESKSREKLRWVENSSFQQRKKDPLEDIIGFEKYAICNKYFISTAVW